jgi:PTS system mannitol-specific IIC component
MKLEQIGRFLSTIVYQNISGLIALGMMRVLFGPSGWWPNPHFYQVVNHILQYFIPVLFAYSGGKIIGGKRGGVVASFVIMGMAAESTDSYPLILPAMAIGPFIGFLISKTDKWLEDRIPVGFELLVYNVVAGLIGVCCMTLGILFITPFLDKGVHFVFTWATLLAESGLLPLVALIIEPGKVLFFNNVINHGILEPLGIQQTKVFGKSIFFLLEANPGPGFGLLLAYFLRLKGKKKEAVKSSLVIQVLGGIHEVYFPYALMRPWVIIPLIAGGMTGDLMAYLLKAGLVATPSPGSILVVLMMTPKGSYMAVFAVVAASAFVSFLGSMYVLSREKVGLDELIQPNHEWDMSVIQEKNKQEIKPIKKIIFACDAGYGSSAMGAAMLRKKLRQADLVIPVYPASVDDIPADADLVITHSQLTHRAVKTAPYAEHLSLSSFDEDEFYQDLVTRLLVQQAKIADHHEPGETGISINPDEDKKSVKPIKKIVFACDGGYGSSAMGAAMLRKKLKQANLDIPVNHASVDAIPEDADLVITQNRLTSRARKAAPFAEHLSLTSFDEDAFYEELISRLRHQENKNAWQDAADAEAMRLTLDHILIRMEAKDKWEAIEQVGTALVEAGNADRLYIEEMKQREYVLSTYLGHGVALPHGIDVNSPRVKKPGIAFAQYPKGIDFGDGNTVYLLIALAGCGSQHLSVLAQVSELIESREKVNQLIHAGSREEMLRMIQESGVFYLDEPRE